MSHTQLQELLNEEIPHKVVKSILAHPESLPSEPELEYMLPSVDGPTLEVGLEKLIDAGIVDIYRSQTQDDGIPSEFYGVTADGLTFLDRLGYLQGVPMLRAVHDSTRRPDRIQRLEEAPRPPLPNIVDEALQFDADA